MDLKLLPVACVALALSACGTLPSAGPSVTEIENGTDQDDIANYILADINERTLDELSVRRDTGLYDRFGDNAPAPSLHIGVGDTVSVTIWEVGPGGLFTSGAAGAVQAVPGMPPGAGQTGAVSSTIPPQIVSRDGDISVPFAGRVHVAGLTPAQAESAIRGRLAGKAMEPQVLVTVASNVSGTVSVMGEVTGAARVPLNLRGDRLLDVIASAGGIRTPVYETTIQLTRDGRTASVPLRVLLDDPRENIYAQPGDVITVTRETRSFTALGASLNNDQVPFETAQVTLVQAIGKARGLNDERADPEGVFIFRYESSDIARALDPRSPLPERGTIVPVVYRLDLQDPKGYLLGQRFMMANGDVMFVSNAPLTDLRKVLSLFQTVISPVSTGIGVSNSVNN